MKLAFSMLKYCPEPTEGEERISQEALTGWIRDDLLPTVLWYEEVTHINWDAQDTFISRVCQYSIAIFDDFLHDTVANHCNIEPVRIFLTTLKVVF